MIKKEHLIKEDNKRKKEKHRSLDDYEKEQLRKYEKKGQKTTCEHLNNE